MVKGDRSKGECRLDSAARQQIATVILARNEAPTVGAAVTGAIGHCARVVNVPTHEYPRRFGDSHIKIWRQWPRFVGNVAAHLLKRRQPAGRL